MQREVLIIDGQQVDVIPNTINRNLQINNLGSAEDRQSNYSNTVKLPLTANNQQVFNFLGVSGNTSRSAYKRLSCSYSVDGIPLIVNGFAEIKATKEHYEVVLYDGVVDLGQKLKDKKLNDLSYNDLNHYLSTNTYSDSLTNSEGYIYALGDFGVNQYGIKVERQVPSVFVHTLWDKIFTEAGVGYSGTFFDSNPDFLSEVVTPPIGYDVQDIAATETFVGSYDTTTITRNEFSQDPIFYEDIFGFSTTFTDPAFTFGADGQIHINEDISTKLTLTIDYNKSGGYVGFKTYLNGSMIKSYELVEGSTQLVAELNIAANTGDILQFRLSGSGDYSELDGGTYIANYGASAAISFDEVSGGFLVDFSTMMGDLKQTDFIKDVMQRHGLVIKPVKGTEDYEFIQFESLLTNRGEAEEWTDKLVGITGESYGTKYAKTNTAKYSYHEDIQQPTHDGELTISDENADSDKTLFTSPYQIPTSYRAHQGTKLYYHPVWEEKEGEIKVKDAPVKLFRLKYVNGSYTFKYFNDSNSTSFTGDIPYLSLEKIDMQYFINTNYKAYQGVVDNYKELDATFYLSELDIYDLDFFKLKYLEQTGKYYYLSKLQHKSGALTSKGKIIEINQFIGNLPVAQLGTYNKNANYGSTNTLTVNNLTTQATPAYYDPESDAAHAIKFTSGFNSQVKLYQAGVEIIDDTEILVSEWDVTIQDMSTTTDAHDVSFTFKIKDAGSMTYGDAEGTLNVSVYEYVNQAPIANAGSDKVQNINTDTSTPDYFVNIDGSSSYDTTGTIVSYVWAIISAPSSHTVTVNDTDTSEPTAVVQIPNSFENAGSYTIELTVTDDMGLTDTDTMILTVNNNGEMLEQV